MPATSLSARAVRVSVYALAALFALLGALAVVPGAAAQASTAPPFDLAVGGSGSVGFQPTWTHPHGAPTDSGYDNDLAAREAGRWPGLTLVRIGCPGATTETMISGGGHCAYRDGTQLETALSFLHRHPSTVLVTIDLGFNDLVRCLGHMTVDTACVDAGLQSVRSQLPQILTALRQAAPAGTTFVGVGHYDPFVADELRGAAGQDFARASLGVIDDLNDVLKAAYSQAGMPMADVAAGFDLGRTTPVDEAGYGTVPLDVARVCALTWMCSEPPLGPNTHPNDDGYRVVANSLAEALGGTTSR